MMHRFPSGVAGEKVHQKRVPHGAPPWLETVRVHFPRYGRDCADELCVTELAAVIWAVQMSTVEFHPWNSRRADTERPDEWRIDLDPMPRCEFGTVRRVARIAQDSASSARPGGRRPRAATACTSTSGSSRSGGLPRCAWLRTPSPARSNAVRRTRSRLPGGAGRDPAMLFVDYNQNARDHTIASAYSVRGVPEATVSTPISWDEIDDVDPREFTIATVPDRFARLGDLHRGIDDSVYRLDTLLEWADRDGLG